MEKLLWYVEIWVCCLGGKNFIGRHSLRKACSFLSIEVSILITFLVRNAVERRFFLDVKILQIEKLFYVPVSSVI